MLSHLPILQVIVPLLGASSCLLAGRPRHVWFFALIVALLSFAMSLALLWQVLEQGTVVYALGGWASPWGIEYRIDALNAFMLVLVSGMAAVVMPAAHTSLARELGPQREVYFYVAFLLCLSGLLGILATGDVFNVFVFLEISALASYTLIALGRDRRAQWAAYRYLIMGTIGATFILIGIGLMYAMTGTLNMEILAQRLPELADSRTAFTAFAFFSVGVCLKLALFPLHLWLPNAYAYAPSMVTVFLAATATKVAVYLLLRLVFTLYGAEYVLSFQALHKLLLVLSVTGIIVASLVAIYQSNVKRLFAYSSVAQIGYIILGIAFGSFTGVTATILHLFNHALMKGAIFMALAGVVYRVGEPRLDRFDGLGRQMPLTLAALVLAGLSLIGLPLTVGFVSKWYLVLAAIERGNWLVAGLVLLGSLLALVYVGRVIERAYFRPPPTQRGEVREAPWTILGPTWLLVLANLYFGIDTRFTVSMAERAAQGLLGVAP